MLIGLLSLEHTHAAGYAALLAAREDVDLIVADPQGFGDPVLGRLVDSYEQVWAARPDAVVVCAANADHAALVLEAARRGIPVLCEKPLATTVADAEAMVAACAEAGVVLMTAFPVHFSPAVATLREAIASGSLGEVIGLTGTNNGKLPTGRDWFTDVERSGGGALVDHVVHLAQILRSVLGDPERVHAVANRILAADRVGEGAETGGLVTLTYPGGVVASIDCSWSQPEDAPTWGGLTLQAVGTGGMLEIDAFAERVEGVGTWLPYGEDLDARLIDTFLEAVRTGERARPDGEDGLATVRVVAAAQRSVATGEPVDLDAAG